jgi:hydroxymethylpyrimidine/phosphomethylpyrimidine kinase
MTVPRVLTIAGSDSGGGAGIQADLKTITVLGAYGMSVITALTAQNTLGVQGVLDIPPEFVEQQFDSVLSDIGADAAKTGMLSSSAIIHAVARKVREYSISRLVVDPVMVAKGGAPLLREDARESLIRELIPLAAVVTPNIPEAEALAGMSIGDVDAMKRAAKVIHGHGAAGVVVKGGHLTGAAVDVLYDGREFHEFTAERIDTRDTHGTGCTFSAAVAVGLARGLDVRMAVQKAKEYITVVIRHSLRIGGGHGPTYHFAPVMEEMEALRTLRKTPDGSDRRRGRPVIFS